jgi:hypothetical protein
MKKPTQKELEQLENAKSTFKEIMKVHMKEPFNDSEIQVKKCFTCHLLVLIKFL